MRRSRDIMGCITSDGVYILLNRGLSVSEQVECSQYKQLVVCRCYCKNNYDSVTMELQK